MQHQLKLLSNYLGNHKWLVLLYWSIILILLLLPGSKLPNATWLNNIGFDKFVHLIIFIGLTFTTISAFKCVTKSSAYLVAFFCTVFGVLIEFVQKEFIPNRSFDIYDIIADTMGVIVGFLFIIFITKKYYE